jgi:hypothetical protein
LNKIDIFKKLRKNLILIMIIYIGFNKLNCLLFETRSFINKLEYGVYFKLEKLIDCDDFSFFELKNFDFSDHNIVDSCSNGKLFINLLTNYVENDLNSFFELILYFFEKIVRKNEIDTNVKSFQILKSYFRDSFGSIKTVSSVFQMALIIIAEVRLELVFPKYKCFNLPAGAGKTYCLDWLCDILNKNSTEQIILVSTPTAKASNYFKLSKVKTIHSTFSIDPITSKIKDEKIFDQKAFIFDEMSMISVRVFESLERLIPNKNIYFVGDFAQLKPVIGKSIQHLTEKFNFIEANDNFFLPRFEDPNLERLVKIVRSKILNPLLLIDENELKFLLSNIKTFDNKKQIDKHVNLSRREFKKNSSFITKNIDSIYESTQKLDFPFNNILPIICSNNQTCTEIHSNVMKRLSIDKNNILNACLFISKTNWNDSKRNKIFIKQIFKNKIIGDSKYKICIGSRVICKKNDKESNVYNGLVGIVVGIQNNVYNDIENEIIEINDSSGDSKLSSKKICIYSKSVKTNVLLYDLDLKTIIKLKLFNDHEYYYKSLNIHPFDCTTIYQLQGLTVVNNALIRTHDNILSNSIQNRFYVLISRAKKNKELNLSKFILDRFFNCIIKIK